MGQTPKPIDIGVEIGTVFLNKYRVEKIIGHGGMGVVAECTHLALGERVAIKMLRKDVLLDAEAVERFQREAQAAAKLKSEYVARVSDVGTFEGNIPYMVMEFLEGHDLGQLLDQRGVLPVPWATELIMQTAEALAEAHSLGIVHRDVKPTNLFVTWRPDGSALIKVLDFGISKSPMGTDMQLTQTQSLLGTPAYMSPEQMRSARLVDWRSDIWSLGSVLYELLEGRRPFEAESFSEMCVKVAVDPPAPMVNTPIELQPVILKCLAKSPDQRYATMAELGAALVPFVQDQHQAQRLVERMTRVLRRSAHNWDGDSSVKTPTDTSGIVRQPQPQWSSKSAPIARAEGSAPIQRPSAPVGAVSHTLMNQRPQRRGLLIVIGVGLLFGAGIAAAVALGNRENANARAALPVPPPAPMVAPPKPAVAPVPAPVPAPVVVKAGSAAPLPAVTEPVQATAKPDVKHPVVIGVKKKPPVIKRDEPEPEVKDVVKDATVKPPTPACDPFNAMHGCGAK
ncbi:MAG: serine/threonine-protein kinase [Kofleriaceae bacterium]